MYKTVKKGNYIYAVVPNHPYSTKNGYVLEHRIVMEKYIGRYLTSDEVVHHKNGDTKDNRIENLELLSRKVHSRMHGHRQGKKWCVLKCPWCGCIFERAYNQTHLSKGGIYTFCSRSCNGKFWSYSKDKNYENLIKIEIRASVD